MLARRVLRNAIYNTSSVLVANLAGLFVSIYVARVLKPELFGIYSLALSLAFLVMSFTDLGIDATTVRYVAHAYSRGDEELVRGYIKSLGRLRVFIVTSVSFILFLASESVAGIFNKPELSIPLKVMAGYVLLYSLSGFVNSLFNAFNDFRSNFVRSTVYEISRVFFIVLFLFLGLSVVGALLGFVVAALLSLLSLVILLTKEYSRYLFGRAKAVEWRRVLRFTGYLTLGSITWTVFAYVDSVMIGIFLPSEYVGFYRAAYNILGAVAGLVSLPSVLFPVFVQLEGEDLKNAFDRVLKYSAILAFPCSFGLAVIAEPLINFVYGAEYSQAVSVMVVLSLMVLLAGMGFWSALFNSKEMPEYPVYVVFAGMLLNVILNYFLILSFGIVGAAVATVLSNAFIWFVLAFESAKIFGISLNPAHFIKPMVSSATMACLLYFFGFSSIFDALLKILCGALLYFALLFALRGLKKEDVLYFVNLMRF